MIRREELASSRVGRVLGEDDWDEARADA